MSRGSDAVDLGHEYVPTRVGESRNHHDVMDPESRAVFIDESGDARTSLLLTAIEMRIATIEAARAATVELAEQATKLLPAFASMSEFHAHRLARPLTPTEASRLPPEQRLRTHERQFLFQHALHHLGDIPGVRVYTVMWRWNGPFKPKGRSGGHRYRDLLHPLLDWVTDDPLPLGLVALDHGGQAKWYQQASDAAQEQQTTTWRTEMVDSAGDPLIQLADLAAYAAFQAAVPGQSNSRPFMQYWYRDALGAVFAPGGDGFGIRHFSGETSPVPK